MNAFIVDGVRSAIGSYGGALASIRPDDLLACVIKALCDRVPSIPVEAIDDVVIGCANQAGEDNRNVARMAALLAGIPETVPAITVNRLCASGLSAVIQASHAIQSGSLSVCVAGGVEHMSRAPYVISKSSSPFGRNQELFDTTMGWRFINPKMRERFGVDSMGETAEHVAVELRIARHDQDGFALRSQQKAARAQEEGWLTHEIVPIEVTHGKGKVVVVATDEFVKGNTTIEGLAALKPAFKKDGTVTAGNSSGINDGACALFVCSEDAARSYNLSPLTRVVASAASGIAPRIMGLGPVDATQKALARAKLTLDDIDVIELNEAFAAQSLGCLRHLGLSDDDPRVNPLGGAIAYGHPLGMSGARLVLTASRELLRRKARYALVTMCVGVGQGVACILERV